MEKNQMSLVPADHEMAVYNTMAKQASMSKYYKNYGDTPAIMAIMLSARELGISPMAALNGGLNIIQGKVEISARMMNAMIRRAGHSLITIKCTDTECQLKGKRADTGNEDIANFSIDEAKRAGLIKSGGGWSKYPSDMLYARALSRLARRLFPDVIGCAYVEGEIVECRASKAEINDDVEVVEEFPSVIEEFPKDFIEKFDKDDQLFITEYVKQVHEKYDISYEDIMAKHGENTDEFMRKFEIWKKNQTRNNE